MGSHSNTFLGGLHKTSNVAEPTFGRAKLSFFERFGEAILKVAITIWLEKYIDVEYMKTVEFSERNLLFKVPFLIGALHI